MEMQKAAFMLVSGVITSMLVDIGTMPTAFELGTLVETLQPLELMGLASVIPAGWAFRVVEHDCMTGLVGLQSVSRHDALHEWHDLLILQPFNTEDALEAFNSVAAVLPDNPVLLQLVENLAAA